jgi:hypothetical protein
MYHTVTVTIKRPNIYSNFWYESEYYQSIRLEVLTLFNKAVDNQQILDFYQNESSDQLVFTRFTIFKDEESKITFMNEFDKKFTEYDINRQTYCSDNEHNLTITEE